MITVRIRFEKTGEAAYISLLDLQRVFHRILKRSGLPVYYTQGFNPHIYLSFACPLSLGQESLCECCEVKTEAEDPQLDTWCDVLQPYMPRGIKVLSAQQAQNKVQRSTMLLILSLCPPAPPLRWMLTTQPKTPWWSKRPSAARKSWT